MARYGSTHTPPSTRPCPAFACQNVGTEQHCVYRSIDSQSDRGVVRGTTRQHATCGYGLGFPDAHADANVVGRCTWECGVVGDCQGSGCGRSRPRRATHVARSRPGVAGPLLLLAAFLVSGRFFLSLLGGSGEILRLAFSYSAMLFGGSMSIWIMGVASSIFRGLGDMKDPARRMIIGSVIQVPLSGALILGYFGSPQLGLLGAAISVIATSAVMAIVILRKLMRASLPANLRMKQLKFDRRHFYDIGRVALPASLSPISTVTTILVLTGLVGQFGEQALAGYGIGSRIEFLMSSLIFGIGASMTSLVGMSIGARDADRAEKIGWTGAGISFVLGGVIGTLLAVFPHVWIPVFTDDPMVYDTAKRFMQIVGPCLALHAVGWALYFASQGAGAMRGPVAALIARPIIAIGIAVLLLGPMNLGMTGVFIGAISGMLAYTAIVTASMKGGAWRRQIPA